MSWAREAFPPLLMLGVGNLRVRHALITQFISFIGTPMIMMAMIRT